MVSQWLVVYVGISDAFEKCGGGKCKGARDALGVQGTEGRAVMCGNSAFGVGGHREECRQALVLDGQVAHFAVQST